MIQNLLNFGNTGMSFNFHELQFSMAENSSTQSLLKRSVFYPHYCSEELIMIKKDVVFL